MSERKPKHEKKRRGNYVDAVEQVGVKGRPGEVIHIDVFHDDWCAIYRGDACNCNPVVKRRKPGAQGGMF